jgi:membrane protein
MRRPGKDMTWRQFGKRLLTEHKKDRLQVEAAALTYYGVLALFPFLVFLVTFGGLLLNPERIAQLVDQLGRLTPGEVANIVGARLRQLHDQAGGGLLALSILGALWVASSGAVSLASAFNRVYGVDETRPFWKVRLIAIAVTVGASALAIVSAVVMFAVPAFGHYLGGGPAYAVLGVLRFFIAFALMILFLAILYRFLPNLDGRFRLWTFGGVSALPLWLTASWAFGFYARHFGRYGAVYGALAGIIVTLIWMWLTSEVILLGAEMNKILTPEDELERQRARTRASVHERRRQPVVPSARRPEPA